MIAQTKFRGFVQLKYFHFSILSGIGPALSGLLGQLMELGTNSDFATTFFYFFLYFFFFFNTVCEKVVSMEPPHDKNNKMTCVPCEASDQPGHPSIQSDQSLRCALNG